MEKVTIGIVNYNGCQALTETLQTVQQLTYPDFEVMVVDNNSTDGSREWLQRQHPNVRSILLPQNLGLPGARNVLLQEARTEYVFLMDNDISVEPNVLTILMEVMTTTPRAAACHPEIMDPNDPTVYHYNGGSIHFLGALVSRPKPESNSERPPYEQFNTISGAALLVRKSVALTVGGFDTDYFFNWEDGDFTARLTLAGYKCLNVPAAVVHHRSKPRGTSNVFYQVRNRWYFMLKLYSWHTLLLILPMLIIFELAQIILVAAKGAAKDYWRANLAVLRDLPTVMQKRKAFRKIKVLRDREWLQSGTMYVPQGLVTSTSINRLVVVFGFGLSIYWQLISLLC